MRECHPKIAEAVKNKKPINCLLWDLGGKPTAEVNGTVRHIIDYEHNQYVDDRNHYWLNAQPYEEYISEK